MNDRSAPTWRVPRNADHPADALELVAPSEPSRRITAEYHAHCVHVVVPALRRTDVGEALAELEAIFEATSSRCDWRIEIADDKALPQLVRGALRRYAQAISARGGLVWLEAASPVLSPRHRVG